VNPQAKSSPPEPARGPEGGQRNFSRAAWTKLPYASTARTNKKKPPTDQEKETFVRQKQESKVKIREVSQGVSVLGGMSEVKRGSLPKQSPKGGVETENLCQKLGVEKRIRFPTLASWQKRNLGLLLRRSCGSLSRIRHFPDAKDKRWTPINEEKKRLPLDLLEGHRTRCWGAGGKVREQRGVNGSREAVGRKITKIGKKNPKTPPKRRGSKPHPN